MKRLEFLERARALAQQQCLESSCLTAAEYSEIKGKITRSEIDTDRALYRKAQQILEDASFDLDEYKEE